MREERIVLEDEADVALMRGQARQIALAKADRAAGRGQEAGHQPQGRRLAAAGRAEQRDELAGLHRKRQVLQHLGRAVMGGDVVNVERYGHGLPISSGR